MKDDGIEDLLLSLGVTFLENHLTDWEIEEVEWVYYHVRNHYLKLRVPGLIRNQSPLIRRFLANLGYQKDECRPNDRDPGGIEEMHSPWALTYWWEDHIIDAFDRARDNPWRPKLPSNFFDSSSTYVPNAAWTHYQKYDNIWRGDSQGPPTYNEVGREPLTDFHDWGWCMWDTERLSRWDLLRRTKYDEYHVSNWLGDKKLVCRHRECSALGR